MSENSNQEFGQEFIEKVKVVGGETDNNSNEQIYQRFKNEEKRTVDYHAIKKGSTTILVFGILLLILNGISAYLLHEYLNPLGWFLLFFDSVFLIICGIFARKGYTWAFIAAIVSYAIGTITPLINLDLTTLAIRISILVMLGNALNNVLKQKRLAKEEAPRQP